MELLILLIGRHGELVLRDEIIEKLWGRDVFIETELGINTAVRKIRQTLGDDPERPRFVQTVVGKGYRFVAAVNNGAWDTWPANGSQPGHDNGAPRAYEPAACNEAPLGAISNGAATAPWVSGGGHVAVGSGTTRSDSEKPAEADRKRSYAGALFAAGTATTVIAVLLLAFARFPRPPLLNHRVP